MKCSRVDLAGIPAIVCGRTRVPHCVTCRVPAERLCDWKVGNGRTCDKGICLEHTMSPAPDKDLCPTHAEMWRKHLAQRETADAP